MTCPAAFRGRWRIVWIEGWEDYDLDLLQEAHISFDGERDGRLAFGLADGVLDVEYVVRENACCAEFAWEGHMDRNPAGGFGRATLGAAGGLKGSIHIFNFEDRSFVARREQTAVRPK